MAQMAPFCDFCSLVLTNSQLTLLRLLMLSLWNRYDYRAERVMWKPLEIIDISAAANLEAVAVANAVPPKQR